MTRCVPAYPPYVSASGARSEADVLMMDELELFEPPYGFARRPDQAWRRIVCAALVSSKTLRSLPLGDRYPSMATVNRMTSLKSQAPVWLHFNRSGGLDEDVALALHLLAESLGGSPDGLQINTPGVSVEAMARIRSNHRRTELVVQVSREGVGSDAASDFDAYVRRYAGSCDHALIDLSRGNGVPLDVEWTADLLRRYAPGWLDLGIRPAVAGGLGPDSGDALARLAWLVGPLLLECSFDAETNVCGPKGLEEGRVALYLRTIADALGVAQSAPEPAPQADPSPAAVASALEMLCCDFDDARPSACDWSLLGRRWRVMESSDFPPRCPTGNPLLRVRLEIEADGDRPTSELAGVITDSGGTLELLQSHGRLIALRRDLRFAQ